MHTYALGARPHILTSTDITTINYTLEWPHLENPSNTTFAGPAQIDICRCPRSDPPSPKPWPKSRGGQAAIIERDPPGHIYTRYKCLGPEVRFKSATEQLWVLEAPHGPINMLRPATFAEREQRGELHENAEPVAYVGKNILLLTGPCPRGRYQAHATLQYLRSLSPEARRNLERISLLVQPYEEDCIEESSKQAYSELAGYILQYLPSFKTLHLNVWDDEQRMRNAASEFSILLHKEGVEIAVGWNWCKGEAKNYTSARAFLEVMRIKEKSKRGRGFNRRSLEDGLIVKERKHGMADRSQEDHVTRDRDEDKDIDFEHGKSDEVQDSEKDQVTREEKTLDGTQTATSKTTRPKDSASNIAVTLRDNASWRSSQTTLVSHDHSGTTTIQTTRSESGRKQDAEIDQAHSADESEPESGQPSDHNNTTRSPQEATEASREDGDTTDDDWTDAALSPISPSDPEEGSWQVL